MEEVKVTKEKAILILQELWKYEKVEYSDYEVRTAIDIAIKALEQESTLDKIQDEIISLRYNDAEEDFEYGYNDALWNVRQIIERHKTESEG